MQARGQSGGQGEAAAAEGSDTEIAAATEVSSDEAELASEADEDDEPAGRGRCRFDPGHWQA